MRQIVLIITAVLVVTGCGSTENEIRHSSTADLQLRRSQLMYRLSMTRMSWGNRPWQSNAYDDVKNDLEEKEAIEQELARRGLALYPSVPSATHQ